MTSVDTTPHLLVFCAKNGRYESRLKTESQSVWVRGSHPCKQRKDGHPAIGHKPADSIRGSYMSYFRDSVNERAFLPHRGNNFDHNGHL